MIDFNIDEIEVCCDSLIADELEYLAPSGMNDAVKVKAFIIRLRQAEKDAARYRWLRDDAADAEQASPLVFMADEFADIVTDGDYQGIMFGKLLDAAIDEAMQCNK